MDSITSEMEHPIMTGSHCYCILLIRELTAPLDSLLLITELTAALDRLLLIRELNALLDIFLLIIKLIAPLPLLIRQSPTAQVPTP